MKIGASTINNVTKQEKQKDRANERKKIMRVNCQSTLKHMVAL